MLKVQRGDDANRREKQFLVRTKETRAIQAIVGAGIVYVSSNATDTLLRTILFFGGIASHFVRDTSELNLSDNDSNGKWKWLNRLADRVTRKQAAIILILVVLVYGSSSLVTALAPSLSSVPNLLVILAAVVICVCDGLAAYAMQLVSRHSKN